MHRRATGAGRRARHVGTRAVVVLAVVLTAALVAGCTTDRERVAASTAPPRQQPTTAADPSDAGSDQTEDADEEVTPPPEDVPDPPAPPEVEAPDPAEVEVEPAPTPELTQPDRWAPGPGEVFPGLKQLAADTAQALTTYPHGSTPEAVAQAAGAPHVAPVLGGLVDPDAASAGTVVYPQMGGTADDEVAIMVVVHQVRKRMDAGRTEETRTLDLRLARTPDGWAVAGLVSDGGPAVAEPAEVSPEAAAVLAHDRIELPDSARWDIYRGHVEPGLLQLVLDIAEHHEIHAVSMSTGHPHEVFGTTHQSNHARGLAIDIYAVDGVPVVEQRHEGSAAHGLAQWLHGLGIPELGSPWAFDGFGGRSFTDVVHHDHLHIGVAPPPNA